MAGLKDIIGSIVAELKTIQAAEDFPGPDHGFPGWIAAGDRGSLIVNENIERSITELSKLLLDNDAVATRQFSNAEWRALVRRSLGPPLATIDLDDPTAAETVRKELRKALDQARSKNGDREYAVGCTLFDSKDNIEPIHIGPVVIETRHQWLDRMIAEQKIGKVIAKRIRRMWAGGKLAKRKNATDQIREKDILAVVGICPFVCSVQTTGLPPESGKQKAITAARMALAIVALAWDRPSSALDGFRLLIDHNLRQIRVLSFEPGKIILAGSRLSHLPSGYTFQPGEWQVQAMRLAPLFAAAGEVLDFVTHATGQVSRGRITPGEWERRTGLRLRFVYRRTGPSLLVAEGRLNKKGRAVASRSKTGRGLTTVPIFLLVPQVRLPKRLDLTRDAERVRDAVPGQIVANWLKGR